MSLSNTTENDLMELIFKATALSWAGITNLYISLHSSDPGEAGSQTTNEVSYTGYSRKAVARSGSGWTVTGNTATNAALIDFDECTGGSATATHFAIGTASSGAGQILLRGALSSSATISAGVKPQFAASALSASVD